MKTTMEILNRSDSSSQPARQKHESGFTLIELMIVIVIVAIGVALAVPTFRSTVEKRQLSYAAESIVTLISFAQSAAVKHNSDVIVNLRYTDHDTWCVGATLGQAACDCSETDDTQDAFCDIEGVSRRLDQAELLPGRLNYQLMESMSINGTAITNDNFTFDPVRGTLVDLDEVKIVLHSNQGSDATAGSRDYQLELDVLPTGRVSICTSSGQKKLLKQYSDC